MTDPTKMLKPCPFCGSDDVDAKGWLAGDGSEGPQCMSCGATGPSVNGWNVRAEPPPGDPTKMREDANTVAVYIGRQVRSFEDNGGTAPKEMRKVWYAANRVSAGLDTPPGDPTKMRQALEPFGEWPTTDAYDDDQYVDCCFLAGDLRRARKALAATEGDGWRSMESVPRDGQLADLGWFGDGGELEHGPIKARWLGGSWTGGYTPTHWKPAPPTDAEDA